MWPSGTLSTFGSRTLIGPGGSDRQPVQAGVGQVQRDVHLLEQHLEPGQAVALGPGHDAARAAGREQLAVRQVGLVAAQVEVEPAGPGDRPADAVRRGELPRQDADPAGPGAEDLVADDQGLQRRAAGARTTSSGLRARDASSRPGRSSLRPPTRLNM